VLIEAPFMLAISWAACAACMRIFRLSGGTPGALAMGGVALLLLMTAEMALAAIAFGRTPETYVRDLGTLAGAEGLAAQIAFGLFPAIQTRLKLMPRPSPRR
jgi:hypothetical protein